MADVTDGEMQTAFPSGGDLAYAAAINNVVSATCISIMVGQSPQAAKVFLDTLASLNSGLIGPGILRDKLQEGVSAHHDIVSRMP